MIIYFQKGFPEDIGVSLIKIASGLNTNVGNYTQETLDQSFIDGLNRTLVVPLFCFDPITFITKKKKELTCDVRFSVSARHQENDTELLYFVLKERLVTKEVFLEQIPSILLESYISADNPDTLADLIDSVVDPDASDVQYFFSESSCERKVTYSIAVVNTYMRDDIKHCVCTTYFSIKQ